MTFTRLICVVQILSLILLTIAAPSSLEPRGTTRTVLTGKIVNFTIDLEWGDLAPVGGIARKVILTNGTMPGEVCLGIPQVHWLTNTRSSAANECG